MNQRSKRTRELGLRAEQAIKEYFIRTGFDVLDSTKEENIKDDIDFKLRNPKGDVITVSVKAQSSIAVYGNVCFELETEKGRPEGVIKPSWWYTGKATHYLIVCDPASYLDSKQIPDWSAIDVAHYIPWYALIDKKRIQDYVAQWGWKKQSWLSDRVRSEEGANALSGYLAAKSIISREDKVLLPRTWNRCYDGNS